MVRTGGPGGAEGRRWYSLDGLRSVVNLTDDSGLTVASYHLDAWGNFRFPSELGASNNRFAFTGYEWDPELGLFNAKARYFDPQIGRFTSQDSFLGQIDNPPSLHRYFYAAANPTKYVDPNGHEFTLNADKKYGPNDVAAPVLSGTVSNADLKQYLGYVEKHGSRGQVIQATLGATGIYSKAYGQQVAKIEAAAIAGTIAAAPVAIAGGSAVAVGAVGGGTQGFVSGLLDKASAAEVAVRTATGAAIGAGLGWAAQKLGAVIYGEASPSVPGASQGSTTAPKPVSGEPPPVAARPPAVAGGSQGADVATAPAVAESTGAASGRTYVTYELKNPQGEVVYVGRASGQGTPEEVLQQRLAKGHHVFDTTPGLRADVKASQGNAAANKGAEGVLYEQRLQEGTQLLNDPKTPPLSSKPSKAAEVRTKIDAYHEDLKQQ